MIAGISGELTWPTNRAGNQARLARFAAIGHRSPGIGPFIGPPWPDSQPSKPHASVPATNGYVQRGPGRQDLRV
jgi:hypothetical protein